MNEGSRMLDASSNLDGVAQATKEGRQLINVSGPLQERDPADC